MRGADIVCNTQVRQTVVLTDSGGEEMVDGCRDCLKEK